MAFLYEILMLDGIKDNIRPLTQSGDSAVLNLNN